jgi:heterodisulfide reductase subunit A-like polyferredoxin
MSTKKKSSTKVADTSSTSSSIENIPSNAVGVDYDVIVVGAGFAGLSTARELVNAGLSVLVLEARQEISSEMRIHVVAPCSSVT